MGFLGVFKWLRACLVSMRLRIAKSVGTYNPWIGPRVECGVVCWTVDLVEESGWPAS